MPHPPRRHLYSPIAHQLPPHPCRIAPWDGAALEQQTQHTLRHSKPLNLSDHRPHSAAGARPTLLGHCLGPCTRAVSPTTMQRPILATSLACSALLLQYPYRRTPGDQPIPEVLLFAGQRLAEATRTKQETIGHRNRENRERTRRRKPPFPTLKKVYAVSHPNESSELLYFEDE
ncbi:hypothetical protein EDB83DRAFT_1638166 [Lactarius deliciosus]|nr:hypothetical protein EDB83DRAFT_1638166 [Lactarius deliciosus]